MFPLKRARVAFEPFGVIGVIGAGSAPFAQPIAPARGGAARGQRGRVQAGTPREPRRREHRARDRASRRCPRASCAIVHGGAHAGVALARGARGQGALHRLAARRARASRARASRRDTEVTVEMGGKDAMLVLGDADLGARRELRRVGGLRRRRPGARRDRARVRRARGLRAVPRAPRRACASDARGRPSRARRAGRAARVRESVSNTSTSSSPRRSPTGRALHCGGPLAGRATTPRSSWAPSYYAPAVLADVTHEMRIMREPIDGPVLAVMRGRFARRGAAARQRLRVQPRRVGLDRRPLPGPADRARAARGDGVAQRPPAEPRDLARPVGRVRRRRARQDARPRGPARVRAGKADRARPRRACAGCGGAPTTTPPNARRSRSRAGARSGPPIASARGARARSRSLASARARSRAAELGAARHGLPLKRVCRGLRRQGVRVPAAQGHLRPVVRAATCSRRPSTSRA